MTQYTDAQIRELAIAYEDLDFSQPKAHEVFRTLEKTLEKVVIGYATSREYWFFKLGRSANLAKEKFDTIPPLRNTSQEKQEATTE
jgi:hypothetical protein